VRLDLYAVVLVSGRAPCKGLSPFQELTVPGKVFKDNCSFVIPFKKILLSESAGYVLLEEQGP